MSVRPSTLIALVVSVTLVLVACGTSEDGGTLGGEPVLTAELVVPPAEHEVVSVGTAKVAPTATTVRTAADISEEEADRVNVPNRGYNAMGSEDAPITMFDFSDFL